MSTPNPGGYVCVKTRGVYAWLIRKLTGSEFNHVAVIGFDDNLFEAEPGGARKRPLSEYDGYEMIFSPDVLTPKQQVQVVAKAEALLDTPYGWTDIARLGLRCMGIQWAWLTRAADVERAMICSQLVAACGESAGLDWNCGRESPAAVTPGDLAERAKRNADLPVAD